MNDDDDLLMMAAVEAVRHCECRARITGKPMYLLTDGKGKLIVTNDLVDLILIEKINPIDEGKL